MTINPRGLRRIPALLLAAAIPLLATTALAGPAQAASYRYWSYWLGTSGTWQSAAVGPGDHEIVDGDVQGWRFSITAAMPSETPDNAPDFPSLCPDLADTGAPDGQLRAAVVVDSGFTAAAPDGQAPPRDVIACVTVPEGSTGYQALAAAAAVSDQGGLVCSINGYPQGECGAEIPDEVATTVAEAAAAEQPNPALAGAPAEQPDDSATSPAGFLAGAAVLAVLLAAAVAVPRLRRRSVGTD